MSAHFDRTTIKQDLLDVLRYLDFYLSDRVRSGAIVRAIDHIDKLEQALRELIERPYDGEGRNLAALDRARAALSTDQGGAGQ